MNWLCELFILSAITLFQKERKKEREKKNNENKIIMKFDRWELKL